MDFKFYYYRKNIQCQGTQRGIVDGQSSVLGIGDEPKLVSHTSPLLFRVYLQNDRTSSGSDHTRLPPTLITRVLLVCGVPILLSPNIAACTCSRKKKIAQCLRECTRSPHYNIDCILSFVITHVIRDESQREIVVQSSIYSNVLLCTKYALCTPNNFGLSSQGLKIDHFRTLVKIRLKADFCFLSFNASSLYFEP